MRLALRLARPHDLARMRHAFAQLPVIQTLLTLLKRKSNSYLSLLLNQVGEFKALYDLLAQTIIESSPVLLRDGSVIATGYSFELDELRSLATGTTDYLDRLELLE